ncbi:MAG: hypothetical protein GXY50_00370 [Syntrophomonadaceae bacterium]|nr:hypothetical protein [Syntrophomonadaceae bacterium]
MNLTPLVVEIALALAAIILLVLGLINSGLAKRINGGAAVLAAMGILVLAFIMPDFGSSVFDGTYISDGLSWFFTLLFLVAAVLVLTGTHRYAEQNFKARWQFPPLVLLAILGMTVMVSGTDLLVIYIGLELMTVTFYLLSAYMDVDLRTYEAGLKYLVLGAFSSAVLLMGLSYLYAMTGGTDIRAIGLLLDPAQNSVIILSLGPVLAGLGSKPARIQA